ncbi:MAG: hypothetical protein ABJN84_10060 [Flavobacteriaceae bacterium]
MEKSKRIFGILLVVLTSSFYGCDEIYECIFNINPEIHNKQLLLGSVDDRYYDIVTAEVSNDVHDNDYDYFFDVIGELPPGIFYDINRRSVEFFGVPEATGTYKFRVELFVESYEYDGYDRNPTCSESTFREFTIQVVE